MSVNLEVKGSLAKCLATENLLVEHKKVPTAMFNVDRRILTLPTWDKASATVYDLLVGHEVGHALYTDNIDWTIDYSDVPKDVVNVLEDVRVERLMKKKYPGLSRTFYNGYNELNNDDFFSTKDENLDKLSLIDRINLYFKIGAFHNIEFNDTENEFLTRASQTETFQEVLDLSRELVKYLNEKKKVGELPSQGSNEGASSSDKQQQSENSSTQEEEGSNQSGQNQSNLSQDSQEQSQSNQDGQGEDLSKAIQTPSSEIGSEPSSEKAQDEMTSKTSRSFDEKSKELVDQNSQEIHYVELPEMNLDTIVIPNQWIHDEATKFYNCYGDSINAVDAEYKQFKKSAEKEVSYLVKEFECKKSADQYARASTARTGILDTQRLHTYKFSEDLFKKVSVIPDGKNHGLIFVLDWSGSMQDWFVDTCKQLFNLIWFCRKVNIPFEVYAFTLDCNAYIELQPDHPLVCSNLKDGVIYPEKTFRMMNLFTSTVNNRVLETQMMNIWRCAYAFENRGYGISCPRHLYLSGTPLGESIIALHKIIPAFQQKNKLQKVNVIFLTDGEGYVNKITKMKKTYDGNTYIGYEMHYKCTIRNRKTGRVYPAYFGGNFASYSKVLLQTIKDSFPTVNLINFRITPTRDLSKCYNWYGENENVSYETVKSKFSKEHFVTFKHTGYDQFNILPSNSLSQDDEFKVDEGASKAQIKTAFTKMLSKKKTNKKLLSSFVELIA